MSKKYKRIYSYELIDSLFKNEKIYVLDRNDNTVTDIMEMTVRNFLPVWHDNNDNRYDVWAISDAEDQ